MTQERAEPGNEGWATGKITLPKYSDAYRTEAMVRLAVNRYDYAKTAEEMGGVTVRSLRNWEKQFPKNTVPELLDRAIERLLMAIPTKFKGQEWAVALGILFDKWFLMQGEPTQRTESIVHGYRDLTDEEREIVVERAREYLGISRGSGDTPE